MIRAPSANDLRELGEEPPAVDTITGGSQSATSPTSDSIYAGDEQDTDGPLEQAGWQTLNIPSPGFLVGVYNKHFREKKQFLYEWQKEQLNEIGESNKTATLHKPYKLALCAANGSGKDYLVVAPTVVWMSLVNVRCLTIITSSSGQQLTAQTENHIKSLCESINEYHQQPIFRIRQRYIKCNLTGSEIRLFATDEAGKAEGYHPLEPDAKMVIIVNEAKTVSEEIFGALKRCTGFTHWLNVSTPGEPSGSFYRSCTKPALGYTFRHVTGFDCPNHLSEDERRADEEEFGKNSALYRSKHLALFTTLDSDSLITTEVIEKLTGEQIDAAFKDWPIRIGGDIAAGGDESVLIATKGNRIIREEAMRDKDTTVTADWFERLFIELGIDKKHEYIFMDDGGIGHAVIDMLRAKGWEIRRVRNETRAVQPTHYGNRGAELWYQVARLAQEQLISLYGASPKLLEQLVSRHYKKSGTGGRIFLESKKEAKADGRPSPDRADAFVLSYTGLTVHDFLVVDNSADAVVKPKTKLIGDNAALEQYMEELAFGEFEEEQVYLNGRRIFNSLAAAANFKSAKQSNTKYDSN